MNKNIRLSFNREQFATLCAESHSFRGIVFDALQPRKRKSNDSPEMAAFKEAVKLYPGTGQKINHIKHVRNTVPGMGLAEAKHFVEDNALKAGANYSQPIY